RYRNGHSRFSHSNLMCCGQFWTPCNERIAMADAIPKLKGTDVMVLRRGMRMQFESAQDSWTLLYPEGMVQLSESAADILERVDGLSDIDRIIDDLNRTYDTDTRSDVLEFLENAHDHRWIDRATR